MNINNKHLVKQISEYIFEHISENITVDELAYRFSYSTKELNRIFFREEKLSVAEYIRKMRLSYGSMLLRNGKKTILDIAFSVGYSSVDGFQKAFKKEFRLNPEDFRKNASVVNAFCPLQYFDYDIFHSKNDSNLNCSIHVGLQHFSDRKFLILRGKNARNLEEFYAEIVDLDLCRDCLYFSWGLFLPSSYVIPGTSEFVIGLEIKNDSHIVISSKYDIISIPASDFLIFSAYSEKNIFNYIEQREYLKKITDFFNPVCVGFEFNYSIPSMMYVSHNCFQNYILKPVKKICK